MVLKGVNWVHILDNLVIRSNGLERSHLGTQCLKSGHMVLKGVNWVHIDKSQLGTQCKNQVIWS